MDKKTASDILIEFYTKMFQGESSPMTLNSYGRRCMKTALSDLKELLKSKVPKKEPRSKIINTNYCCGRNDAIDQFNQVIEEMFE